MRAFLSIKYHDDHENRPLIEAISSAFAKVDIETACIVRDVEKWGRVRLSATTLMQKTFEILETCDFVLVDLSEKGMGIGIEAGYAYATKKPIFTIAHMKAEVSESLKGISTKVFQYNELTDLIKLARQLQHDL